MTTKLLGNVAGRNMGDWITLIHEVPVFILLIRTALRRRQWQDFALSFQVGGWERQLLEGTDWVDVQISDIVYPCQQEVGISC